MRFETHLFADISTEFLERGDLELLSTAPNHLAEVGHGYGSIFYLPGRDDDFEDYASLAKGHGLSDRFVEIMKALYQDGIPYVRFDADGGNIQGLDHGSAGKA